MASSSTPLLADKATRPAGNTLDSTVIPMKVGPSELLATRTIPAKYTPRMSGLLQTLFMFGGIIPTFIILFANPFQQNGKHRALTACGFAGLEFLTMYIWFKLDPYLKDKYGAKTLEVTAKPLETDFWTNSTAALKAALHTNNDSSATATDTALTMVPLPSSK